MTLLGDALEAMSTCGQRWPSLRADLRWWLDEEAEAAARDVEQEARGFPREPVPPPGSPWARRIPAAANERRGLFTAVPGSLRVDWSGSAAVTIVRGEEWRRRRRNGRVEGSQPADGGNGLLALRIRGLTLVRPWQILSYLDLSAGHVREREGRSATRLLGVPRGGDFRGFRQLHGLAHGDSYDLVVDDATGVLVEMVARWGERDVERCTLHDLRVGEPVDPALFDLNTVGAVEDTQPAIRTYRPLAALVDEVDFTLLAPPDEAYLGLVERHDDGVVVVAHPYRGRPPERRLWFSQSLGAKMADPASWETIELPDGTPARWWSPDNDPERGHVRFERAGIQVWVQGRGRDEIRNLAARLEPIAP
jgi:hypothetical protein